MVGGSVAATGSDPVVAALDGGGCGTDDDDEQAPIASKHRCTPHLRRKQDGVLWIHEVPSRPR